MKTKILFTVLLAQLALGGIVLAKHHHSSSGLSGTWRNDRTGETMTIAVNGDSAVITFSSGSPDSGTVHGDTIDYQGVSRSDAGMIKATGTIQLSADGNSLIKRRALYYPNGVKTEGDSFTRVSGSGNDLNALISAFAPRSSSGFAGSWHAERGVDSDMSITLNGSDAVLTYTRGSPDSGILRGNTITYQGVRNDQGTLRKVTGSLELSRPARL